MTNKKKYRIFIVLVLETIFLFLLFVDQYYFWQRGHHSFKKGGAAELDINSMWKYSVINVLVSLFTIQIKWKKLLIPLLMNSGNAFIFKQVLCRIT